MHTLRVALVVGLLASLGCVAGPQATAAPAATSARPGVGNRASMETMQIPSHGELMNALVYVAAGAGPHPAVILLHGFPGNERNLDLAQDIRRAGWDVLYFNYRGSWGTPGDFSFSHGIEDTAAALAYLRQPAIAKKLRLDPSRIVLIGHSTPDGLAREVAVHAAHWAFPAQVPALKDRTVLVVTADDGLTGMNDAFAAALRKAGDAHVTTQHFATDHAYSDKRIELSQTVLAWLAGLSK